MNGAVTVCRDFAGEYEKRVAYLRDTLARTGAKGYVFANSGGKDCALVGILLRGATNNVTGVMLPCHSARNYGEDMEDARALASQYDIRELLVDLTSARAALLAAMPDGVTDAAAANIAPRLRMTTVYTLAQSTGCLVAGTGNRSETHVGYFTKWGDGAYDVNPIADLTATEVRAFLKHLGAPANIICKAPSAGLYEGQTDEAELGMTYAQIDRYLLTGEADADVAARVDAMHSRTAHKRALPARYGGV